MDQLKPEYNKDMENAVFTLNPYRSKFGVWAFDDDRVGLKGEPFVGETNTLIDSMVLESGQDIQVASSGICLMFSAFPFPGHQCSLVAIEKTPWGTTYVAEKQGLLPWLCPALFKYFPEAPDHLYGMVVKS